MQSKESIQRKSRPDTAYFLRAAVVIGGCQMGAPAPLSTHGMPDKAGQALLAVPLRAIPDGNVSARRGIREFWLRCA